MSDRGRVTSGGVTSGGVTYAERLTAPPVLFAAVWAFGLTLGVSFYAALGPVAGALALLGPAGLVTAVLVRAAAPVQVRGGELLAGEAWIPVHLLGPVEVLDAEQARRVRGPESDPAAFHLIRGWIPAGVKAAVLDPADPTPYWFVASRRPDRLAAAIEAARHAGNS